MKPFAYDRATEANTAIGQVTGNNSAKFLAGGTNLLDLMQRYIEQPDHLTDINRLGWLCCMNNLEECSSLI
jgi:xanthine dehydrogenase YagS FAD-binding subunit